MSDKRLCQARRYNDEMMCHVCKLCWDIDEEPPGCNPSSGSPQTPTASQPQRLLNETGEAGAC